MRLLAELPDHVAALLPDYRDSLEEGYAPAQLAALLQPFEARIGTRLPPAYYALYEQFDGDSCGLAFGWFFTSLGRAAARQQSDESGWYASPDNPDQVQPRSHSSRRLPIAEDYGGSVIYLDYDPAPGGTPGRSAASRISVAGRSCACCRNSASLSGASSPMSVPGSQGWSG